MSVARKVMDHPLLTVIVFVLIAVVAGFVLPGLKIDMYPKITIPKVVVVTTYDNAGPESVEKEITQKLEEGLASCTGLKKMTSKSTEGVSIITLEFNYGVKIDSCVNNTRDKIDTVRNLLPKDAMAPQLFQFDPSAMPIVTLSLKGNRSEEELRQIADDQVKDFLTQVDGVARSEVTGGLKKIVRVELDQNRLDAYGISIGSIKDTLAAQNLELGGGNVYQGSRKYMLRTMGEFKTIDEVNEAIVGNKDGYNIHLYDVGTAEFSHKDITSQVYINGVPGVYIQVIRQSGANTVNVADAVIDKVKDIQDTLPQGVQLEVIQNNSVSIKDTMNELLNSILEGFILAVVILFIFLRNVKSTLIIAISIPFSILITLLSMAFLGISLNMITMTGLILGLGMVVDASVVVLENIFSYRERGTKPSTAAVIGTSEVMNSVVSGNLTTICVFIPFFLFESKLDILGVLFTSFMSVILIAILASLFVAMFLVPVLAGKFLPVSPRSEKPLTDPLLIKLDSMVDGSIKWITEKYRKALRFVLDHQFVTITLSVALLIASFIGTRHIAMKFMPDTAETSVTVECKLPLGTSFDTTQRQLNDFAQYLAQTVSGYENIVVMLGKLSSDSLGSEKSYVGEISVYLPPISRQQDKAKDVKRKMRDKFADFPMVEFNFVQDELNSITGNPVDVAVHGKNLDESLEISRQIRDLALQNIPVIAEPKISLETGLPQIEIRIDRERAMEFGITVADIAAEVNYGVNGVKSTVFRQNGKDYDLYLYLQDEDRKTTLDLDKIYVNSPKGRYALSNFVELVQGFGPVQIERENQIRIVHLTAQLTEGGIPGEVENELKKLIKQNIIVPDGVTITFEGSSKKTAEVGDTFVAIVILAIILVFGVMAGTYESLKDPFINLFTMPFLWIGVVIVQLLKGQDFSMISMIGVVMLLGMVVNNGIILVDQTKLLVERGMPIKDACEDAGASRLRPVLMTTLTTVFGMIPMAFFANESSSTTQPIGLVCVGGLTSSTIVTLFLIPIIYYLFNRKKAQAMQDAQQQKKIRALEVAKKAGIKENKSKKAGKK